MCDYVMKLKIIFFGTFVHINNRAFYSLFFRNFKKSKPFNKVGVIYRNRNAVSLSTLNTKGNFELVIIQVNQFGSVTFILDCEAWNRGSVSSYKYTAPDTAVRNYYCNKKHT